MNTSHVFLRREPPAKSQKENHHAWEVLKLCDKPDLRRRLYQSATSWRCKWRPFAVLFWRRGAILLGPSEGPRLLTMPANEAPVGMLKAPWVGSKGNEKGRKPEESGTLQYTPKFFLSQLWRKGAEPKEKSQATHFKKPKFRANPQAPIGLALPRMMQSPNRQFGVCPLTTGRPQGLWKHLGRAFFWVQQKRRSEVVP